MNIQLKLEPFHHIIINDLYSEKEYNIILEEMKYLLCSEKMYNSNDERAGAAKSSESNYSVSSKKNSKNIWITKEHEHITPTIVKNINKVFDEKLIISDNSWFFKYFNMDICSLLFAYYEDSDYYNSHSDESYATAVTWFFDEPKAFDGGDLHFPDYDYNINVENNKFVIFPGVVKHEVTLISKNENAEKHLYPGRFSLAQFFNVSTGNILPDKFETNTMSYS